ncbi:hypothetical protein J4218_05545 [Candidatus Pacearchaeota archaeon]|nr:hypothetical protein [Candidatus Pacearchaeota archaeon]
MEENNSPVAENSQSEILKKIKHNPWMGSTAVLGVIVIILLATMFYPNLTGNVRCYCHYSIGYYVLS